MIKKISLIVLSLVICLTLCFSVVACGGESFDGSALQKQIDDLQTSNSNMQSELNSLKSKNTANETELASLAARLTVAEGKISSGSANKIFDLSKGENEVTISSYGYDLFKIKINSAMIEGQSFWVRMNITNINMPNLKCTDYIALSVFAVDYGSYTRIKSLSTVAPAPNETSPITFSFSTISSDSRLYFGFPNSDNAPFIPYAIFKV